MPLSRPGSLGSRRGLDKTTGKLLAQIELPANAQGAL
jgi:hypothetical protein